MRPNSLRVVSTKPGDVGVVGDIGDDREQVGVSGGELPERRFVAGRDDDTSTGTGEGERGFFADAAGGAVMMTTFSFTAGMV